jgi:hypothetical protein
MAAVQMEPGVPDDRVRDEIPLATAVAPHGITHFRSSRLAWRLMWIGYGLVAISLAGPIESGDNWRIARILWLVAHQAGLEPLRGVFCIVAVLATVPVFLRYRNSYALSAVIRLGQLLFLLPPILMVCFAPLSYGWGLYAVALGCMTTWSATLLPRIPIEDSSRGFAILPAAPPEG